MKRVDGALNSTGISRSVVTIGNFDGVHLGHREIISKIVAKSKEIEGVSVVMVFDPHPRKVLFPEKKISQIYALDDQENVLTELGVDYWVVEPFSRSLSQLSPEDFFMNYILKPFSPKALIVGYDFAFGANRQGSHKILEELTKKNNIDLEIISPYKVDDVIVSSTEIKKLIIEGDIQRANRFLGREFYIKGIVEKGDQRGRSLGFPTANVKISNETNPKTGVYATRVKIRGKVFDSVTNIGNNPTFHSDDYPVKVETYIFDFNENIYGEEAVIYFYKHIRDEKKFSSVDELKNQINDDIIKVKAELK